VSLLLRELPDAARVEKLLGSRSDADAVLTLLELLRVARDAYAILESNFEQLGLTDAKWALLMQLYTEPSGRLLPSALASRLLVTRGAISGLVRGAERAGLVRRVPHPTDRRKYFVALVPRGRRLIARALPGYMKRVVAYMSVLSPAERQSLAGALRRLFAALPLLNASGAPRRAGRVPAIG
jgi:DNA-binding MarR family transcriptional regulator